MYNTLPNNNEISRLIQVVKQIMHENNFRKNLVVNDLEKHLLANKYSI